MTALTFAQPDTETPPFAQPADEAPAFSQPGNSDLEITAERLRQVIRDASSHAPRTLQKTLGPSGADIDCDRRLAYTILNWPKANTGGDPLASIIGTAFHAWAADAFSRPELNGRYLVERHLTIAPPYIPGGSCDLYDTVDDDVADWKVVGKTSLDTYKRSGPRRQYIGQAHLYGLGWELLGYHPKTVTLAFVPRAGLLSGLWLWRQPYDRTIALRVIARVAAMRDLIVAIDPETQPANWALIPAAPDHGCTYCDWYRPGSSNLGEGCPGNLPPKK